MTNTLALIIGGLLISALVLDQVLFDGATTLFLGQKFFELTEYLAVWR